MFGLPLDPVLLVPFMAAGVLVNITPGADVGFVLASGLRGDKRRGIAAALGISLGSLLHTVLAAMGVAALLHSHVWAYDALRYLGAAYLVVLAWRAWIGVGAPLSATDAAAWGAVYLYGSGCHNRLRGAGGISIYASSAS